MHLTLPEIAERLKQIDEITLLEILGITAEDIVERFGDIIEDRADFLQQHIDWDE